MKKILTIITLLLVAATLFAQEATEPTYDLSYKFKAKEVQKSYAKIDINGQMNTMSQVMPYKSTFDGIMTQTTSEITKEGTAKNIISYDIKDIKSSDMSTSEMVKPKTIGFEMDPKGKLYNVLNEKGEVTQKLASATGIFPAKEVKVGETWDCITNVSGISLNAKSTLTEVKDSKDGKLATIITVIDTPLDVNQMMQLMGMSTAAWGAYDQMQVMAYCKGENKTIFNIDKGQSTEEKVQSQVYLEGSMYQQIIMQAQFQINYDKKLFTKEDLDKYAK